MRTEEVAKMLDWDTRKTARWLDGLAEIHPSLITRVNGRRTVTLAALRLAVPGLAKRFASDIDLEEVHEEMQAQKRENDATAAELREFRRKSYAWFAELGQRMSALEKKAKPRA